MEGVSPAAARGDTAIEMLGPHREGNPTRDPKEANEGTGAVAKAPDSLLSSISRA